MKIQKQCQLFVFFYFGLLQIYFQQASAEDAIMCGTLEADPEKTCVSIRLPWQLKPIYFCTEKDKFKYRKQNSLYGNLNIHHCGNDHNEKNLLVATPWDNCPLSSVPDPCVDTQCPSKPFNRTCSVMPPPEDERMECCGKYFCENGKQEDCKFKILEPECNRPKDKVNCSVFIDPHGCCPKYQCEGDGKPGVCPSASKNHTGYYVSHHNGRYASSRQHKMQILGIPAVPEDNVETYSEDMDSSSTPTTLTEAGEATSPSPKEDPATAASSQLSIYPHPYRGMSKYMYGDTATSCVGDYNCPGTMKCCSRYSRYEEFRTGNQMQAVSGYCAEPLAE